MFTNGTNTGKKFFKPQLYSELTQRLGNTLRSTRTHTSLALSDLKKYLKTSCILGIYKAKSTFFHQHNDFARTQMQTPYVLKYVLVSYLKRLKAKNIHKKINTHCSYAWNKTDLKLKASGMYNHFYCFSPHVLELMPW